MMTTDHQMPVQETTMAQERIETEINNLMTWLPDPALLSAEVRRGIIARYSAVLEGNFIYWMTATYLAVRSPKAKAIIIDNLMEEVKDTIRECFADLHWRPMPRHQKWTGAWLIGICRVSGSLWARCPPWSSFS